MSCFTPRATERLAAARGCALVLSVAVLVSCTAGPRSQRTPLALGAVAMPDAFAAEVATSVLAEGGNAVDAAVAAAFSLAVTYPEAGNIGGGGFLLTLVDGEASFLDYREVAPAAATREMFLDTYGDVVPQLSLVGHLASGVPATVAGLWAAHERYGSLPWARLVAPATRLAEEGFLPPRELLDRVVEKSGAVGGRTNFDRYFGAVRADERFRQPELAATLRRIAAEGRDGFYQGRTAELLAEEMERGGGLVTAADLAAYDPVWREPLDAPWRDYRILSAPPPSSGGFAVIQLLEMKDHLADAFDGVEHHSGQYVHLVAEMEKRVFADRAEYLGDPDVVEVPIGRLIDPTYIHARADEVDRVAISSVESVSPGLEESPDTTHFSIVDGEGNVVSNTYTLNTSFGSGVVVEGAGFLLNSQMDDFSAKPGVPNVYGVVGADANAVAPGKRMLSSMSPTILLREGELAMVLGTPGGSTIFTTVFQVVTNILDFGMSPMEAVSATRFHHQLLPPDLVTYSPGRPLPAETVAELEARGYRIEEHGWDYGDVEVIWSDGGTLVPASDPRHRGVARTVTLRE